MPTHFICKGSCKGVSPVQKLCGSPTCELHGKPLVGCQCTDGKHKIAGKPKGNQK